MLSFPTPAALSGVPLSVQRPVCPGLCLRRPRPAGVSLRSLKNKTDRDGGAEFRGCRGAGAQTLIHHHHHYSEGQQISDSRAAISHHRWRDNTTAQIGCQGGERAAENGRVESSGSFMHSSETQLDRGQWSRSESSPEQQLLLSPGFRGPAYWLCFNWTGTARLWGFESPGVLLMCLPLRSAADLWNRLKLLSTGRKSTLMLINEIY